MRPVAIIENNATARFELRNAVEDAGFRTDCFEDSESALTTLRDRAFALVIFDLNAGGVDPFAVCHEISRVAPLITVTAACDSEICARALESGADDCVKRPLAPRELIARVRNVLRRTEQQGELTVDSMSISISEMRVRNGTEVHELSRGEAEVLALLAEHSPKPLSPTHIAQVLGAKPSTVQSRIKSLRRKLGPERLATRSRLGYYLVSE